MWRNSLGQYTISTTFIPKFPEVSKEFKPMIIKRVSNEIEETKTTESVCGVSTSTESGITPQDQQTTPQETEQADT